MKDLDDRVQGPDLRDQVARPDRAGREQGQRGVDVLRAVVKRGHQIDLAVVQARRVERRRRAPGQSSEQQHFSAARRPRRRRAPDRVRSCALDHDIGPVRPHRPERAAGIGGGVDRARRSRPGRLLARAGAAAHGGDLEAAAARFENVEQSDRTEPDHRDARSRERAEPPPGVHDAGERLEKRGLDVRQPLRFRQEVPAHDAGRQPERVPVGPDGHLAEQGLAQILASEAAGSARAARRRRHEHDGLPGRDVRHARADGDDVAGPLVSERAEGDAGMPAAVGLEVRAARQRGADADDHLAVGRHGQHGVGQRQRVGRAEHGLPDRSSVRWGVALCHGRGDEVRRGPRQLLIARADRRASPPVGRGRSVEFPERAAGDRAPRLAKCEKPLEHPGIALVGGAQAPVRHPVQRPLDLPDVVVGQPPVAPDELVEVAEPVAHDAPGPVHVGIDVAHHEIVHGPEPRAASVEAEIPRARHGAPASVPLKHEQLVIQAVLRLEIDDERRVAVLAEHRGGRQHRLDAVRGPLPDDTAKRPERPARGLPVVRQGAQIRLDVARRPMRAENGPLPRREARCGLCTRLAAGGATGGAVRRGGPCHTRDRWVSTRERNASSTCKYRSGSSRCAVCELFSNRTHSDPEMPRCTVSAMAGVASS